MKLNSGYGVYYESDDRKYLDFTSGGIFQAILGNDFPQVPIHKASMVSCYGHTNEWTERYKDMLREFTGFESVALFTTGSEATEAFWRCMREHTGKGCVGGGLVDPDNVGTEYTPPDSMHGVTLGALIAAGRFTWPGVTFSYFDTLNGKEMGDLCGCIMEPYHAPSAQFHKIKPTIERIISNCKEFPDIPLCVDEVQGGFGRTGRLFAHEWYDGLKPDFVTIGKAMGAGFPISALLGPKEIMESKAVVKDAHLHSTHSGHPMMCSIGCAVIEEIQKRDLIDHSQHLGVFLKNQLEDIGVRHHAGRGLMAGLEFENHKQADLVYNKCLDKGLMVVPTGRKWLKLGPAFIITEEQIEFGVNILKEAIQEVLDAWEPETRGDSGGESGDSEGDVSVDRIQATGSGDAESPKDDRQQGTDDRAGGK